MRTICKWIEYTKEATKEIERIKNDFPCFVLVRAITEKIRELEILCREEDAGSIEERLARLV